MCVCGGGEGTGVERVKKDGEECENLDGLLSASHFKR